MTRIAMFALLTVPLLPDPAQSEEPATVIPPRTTWNLKLDRTLDGRLDSTDSHLLSLQSANDQLVGTYQDKGPTATGNHSVLTGRFIPGSPPLVSLRQDDALGYTALYTGRLVSEDRIVGSYVDNRGSSGDWSLTRVIESAEQGDQVLEPLVKQPPDELLYESVLGTYGRAIRGERHPYVNLRPPARNLWTEEIQRLVRRKLSYEQVDYIGTAHLLIPESGAYVVELPGAGVQFRVNGRLMAAGEVYWKSGWYEVEIYTNHWGQPYLTYAEVSVRKKGNGKRLPFVNTASEVQEFRSRRIDGRRVVEVCDYAPRRVDPVKEAQ